MQTGSNFGLEVKHDNPFLTTIGSGTMVADGLSVVNVDYSGLLVPAWPRPDRRPQLPGQLRCLPAATSVG